MKRLIPLTALVLLAAAATAQDFTGQWKGSFIDKSSAYMSFGGESCEYVLELECDGTKVTGFSYTYFNESGKRYFTICRLKGYLNKASKYVEVTEVERTKTNVPVEIRNCFQIHKLTFFKQGTKEILRGSWVPAPNQPGDCGYGTTELNRRVMQQSFPSYNKTTIRPTPNTLAKKLPDLRDRNKTTATPPVAKKNVQEKETPVLKKDINQPAEISKTQPKATEAPLAKKEPAPVVKQDLKFNQRNNSLLKTIEVENENFRVDLYDNGEIDGDTITLMYNGRVLLSNKRLSDKAITLTLAAESNQVNELVMYAENLGSIPPNTALMVVTDGNNRYEVRITSDTQKNGAIRFVHRPPAQ